MGTLNVTAGGYGKGARAKKYEKEGVTPMIVYVA